MLGEGRHDDNLILMPNKKIGMLICGRSHDLDNIFVCVRVCVRARVVSMQP